MSAGCWPPSSVASVLAWSAIPLGTLIGSWLIERTGNAALIYGAIGALTVVFALTFAFTALGRAERYLPSEEAAALAAGATAAGGQV